MTQSTYFLATSILLLVSSTQGFAPHRPLGSTAFLVQQRPASLPASSTALSMNLFDRFTRVAKSNINNVLKNLEDPEKIMTQALEDMQVNYQCGPS